MVEFLCCVITIGDVLPLWQERIKSWDMVVLSQEYIFITMARGNILGKEEKVKERKKEDKLFQTVLLKGYIKNPVWEAAILIYRRI